MENIVIWGTGNVANEMFDEYFQTDVFEIIGVIDGNSEKWGSIFKQFEISSPNDLLHLNEDLCIDCVVVLSDSFYEIRDQIRISFPQYSEKIENKYYIYKKNIIEKYKNCDDIEIKKIIDYLNTKPLGVFNYSYIEKYVDMTIDVDFDSSVGMYYAIYHGRRMYFSKDIDSISRAKEYFRALLIEQDINSPHKYCDDNVYVKQGDVIVDVGVAEGNFSLEYIEVASEIYIVEADLKWIEALEVTFKDYMEKVHIIQCFVGAQDNIETKKLDSLIDKPVNFVKMDIEGYECDALKGMKRIIDESSGLRMSICAYHSKFDQNFIEEYMDENDIMHYNSNGYMWFPYDFKRECVSDGLSRGIIRGIKRN